MRRVVFAFLAWAAEGKPELYNPEENMRTYSSTYDGMAKGKGLAQSKLEGPEAWLRDNGDEDPWMYIKLSEVQLVTGVALQGRKTSMDPFGKPVNQYTRFVRLAYSLDTETWTNIGKFQANSDRNTIKRINFDGVEALYIRIVPTSWTNHPCIRAALYVEPLSLLPKTHELYNPREDLREYSSTWDNAKKGKSLAQSKLSGNGAWVRNKNDDDPWMYIDLAEPRRVTGLYLQGRHTKEGILNHYTSQVRVSYSLDVVEWTNISEFSANYDSSTVEPISFDPVVEARYVRIVPLQWNELPAIRAALHVETRVEMPTPPPTFPLDDPENGYVSVPASRAALVAAAAALAFIH
jgi:hypothetical protein